MFSLEIGVGIPPAGSGDDRGSVGDIPDIFSFHGSVKVTLNTTLRDETFIVPQEFLAVLPNDFPGSITITAGAPEIDGSVNSANGAGFYIQAIVTGTIEIKDVLTFSGTIGVTLQVGTVSFVRIQGAVTTNIAFLGSLSGSIDLGFYVATGDSGINPGIVGRIQLHPRLERDTRRLVQRRVPARREPVRGVDRAVRHGHLPDERGRVPRQPQLLRHGADPDLLAIDPSTHAITSGTSRSPPGSSSTSTGR